MEIHNQSRFDVPKVQQNPKSKQALEKVSKDMESLFVNQLFQEMRKSVPESSLFGDAKAEKLFESMLDEEMSKKISQSKGLGLSRMIYEQMIPFVSNDNEKE